MYIILVTRTEGDHTFTFVLDICLSKRKAEKICKEHQASVPTDICWLDMGENFHAIFTSLRSSYFGLMNIKQVYLPK